jgi:hypothetical protein
MADRGDEHETAATESPARGLVFGLVRFAGLFVQRGERTVLNRIELN